MELKSRYPTKLSNFSSHRVISQKIIEIASERKDKLKVLDIGCSTGGLGDLVCDFNVSYVGIEPYEEDFIIAKSKGYDVHRTAAEDVFDVVNDKFDIVVLGDVLEHLVDPNMILKQCQRLLNVDGFIAISIPNVAHWSVRLFLLSGKWNYTTRGILDRTHLRFFTRRTLQEMVRDAGYSCFEERFTPIPLETILNYKSNFFWKTFDALNYAPSRILPNLFAFQFIQFIKIVKK